MRKKYHCPFCKARSYTTKASMFHIHKKHHKHKNEDKKLLASFNPKKWLSTINNFQKIEKLLEVGYGYVFQTDNLIFLSKRK